jgi:hypothetical protein
MEERPMKVNFGFVRTAETKLLANGTIKIYGGLLDELKQLRAGDVLQLTGKDGRKYIIANWDDVVTSHSAPEQL